MRTAKNTNLTLDFGRLYINYPTKDLDFDCMTLTHRWLKLFLMFSLIISSASCRSKKEFVITDDYVNKETGGKASTNESVKLSETDKKYLAVKLGVDSDDITNDKLYAFVKAHEGKKFSLGSAAVVSQLYDNVYNKKVTGRPVDIVGDKRLELFKATENLREGDIVFFRANADEVVTHVGVYLKNDRFFSSENNKAGIFNLKKSQWKNNFVSAGRLKQ